MDSHGNFQRHNHQPYSSHDQRNQYNQQQQQFNQHSFQHNQQFQQFPPQPNQHQPQPYPHQQQHQQQQRPLPPPPHQETFAPVDPSYAALETFAHQHGMLGPADVRTLLDLLEVLMRDCSQTNTQSAGNWIAHHCHSPQHYDALARSLVTLVISRKVFIDKLNIAFLVNDIILQSERNHQRWIKDAFLQHLVPLLRVIYYSPGIEDSQRQRVDQILDAWRSEELFPVHVISAMEHDMKRPPILPAGSMPAATGPTPAPPHHQFVQSRHQPSGVIPEHPSTQTHAYNAPGLQLGNQQPIQQAFGSGYPPYQQGLQQGLPPPPPLPAHVPPPFQQGPLQMPQHHLPPGQYHHSGQHIHPAVVPIRPLPPPPPAPTHRDAYTKELPAALMISKIDPKSEYYEPFAVKVSIALQQKELSAETIASVDKFLEDLSKAEFQSVKDEGWQAGVLDEYLEKSSERRQQRGRTKRTSRSKSDHDRRKEGDSRGRRRSLSRSRSRSMSRSRSRTRSRSYSLSRSRSRTKSRSPSGHRRNRSRESRDGARRTSKSRSRSQSRGRGRLLRRHNSRSRSRSQTPPRSFGGIGSRPPQPFHRAQFSS